MPDEESRPEWWNAFFAGVWPEVASGMKDEEQSGAEADYVRRVLGLEAGGKVLDVPCGNGRIGIRLAAAGCEVTGIDLQQSLVEGANRQAESLSVPFTGRQGDMRDLPWWDEFDAAICFWSAIGYFDDAGNREFLEAVWRSLKPGCPLLVETQNVETSLPGFVSKDSFRAGEWTVLEERHWEHEAGRLRADWTFLKDGAREEHTISLRLYTYRELCELLTSCGFGDFEAFDTLTDTPFSIEASRLTLIARKHA